MDQILSRKNDGGDNPERFVQSGAHKRGWALDFDLDRWLKRTDSRLNRAIRGDDAGEDLARQDANEGFFFEEQLQAVLTRVFNRKWPRLDARSKLFIDSVENGKNKLKWRGYEGTGIGRIRAPGSTDMPLVDASGEQDEIAIRTNWLGANYDIEELTASAASGGEPLESALMMQCRRGLETRFDLQLRFGDPGTATTGLLNNADVETFTMPTGDWFNAARTTQEVIDDVEALINDVDTDTNGVHGITRMDFDPRSWGKITKPLAAAAGGYPSILAALKDAHPEITFERWHALRTSGGGGVSAHTGLGGIPQIFAWEDSDEVVWSAVAREASPEAPQLNLATYTVMWLQRVVPGAVFTYPKAARYVTNHIV